MSPAMIAIFLVMNAYKVNDWHTLLYSTTDTEGQLTEIHATNGHQSMRGHSSAMKQL